MLPVAKCRRLPIDRRGEVADDDSYPRPLLNHLILKKADRGIAITNWRYICTPITLLAPWVNRCMQCSTILYGRTEADLAPHVCEGLKS